MSLSAEFLRFPPHWTVLPFTDAVKDATSGNAKLKKEEYLTTGSFPIVDQGQSLYGGYTDREDSVCKSELPIIVFGDHTRAFKFINEPFALGADGAKVLEPKVELDKGFLFHYLKQLRIESAGYSRHYKFLKESYVPVPPLVEQKRIAAILDKADAIRRKRQQAIKLAGDFLRSVFLDMFGDPNSNSKNVPVLPMTEVFNIKTGSLNSNAAVVGGRYPFFTCAKEVLTIDDYAFEQEALLLAGNNAQADYDVKHYKGKFNAYQRTYVLTLMNESWSYPFYKFALEYQLANFKRLSKGSNTKYITMEIMRRTMLPVPSQSEQRSFVKYYENNKSLQRLKAEHEQEFISLVSSLRQRAFTGQL
ncbi:MAG: restriction endonuclease subunit S [Pseudomonadota bacterium]